MSLLDDYPSPISMPTYETLTLERLRFGLQEHVGAHVLESLQFEAIEDRILRGMVYRLKADVLAEKLPPKSHSRSEHVTFEFPSSPWQHWKQKHAESWWLRWFVAEWPVKRETHRKLATLTVDLEKYRTFPKCDYVVPEKLGSYVNVAIARDRWSLT